ncbi:uncharacterized protein Eint_070750 [Encephalitozoon intestinalis ATCC 50506]|uniref:Uncharacterized protein n=1 Tax=Encephalitozoon intestinalis (strain ATCC 50506) TaxID=876142 RepID=E0S804_ENCIT|nr:uncharacterized protein Eint_070750 [Encephalitozoon intestinalis ATCC 50506]ADM11839.1 hypothetical protein Eint_070750 [Encephalitozoon intestinalis ATCC 50506]UTX45589.1 hypothetical protein GPK93_07g11530 [Encephalitozoon intestinalis]
MILNSLFKNFKNIKRYQKPIKAILVVVPLLTFKVSKETHVSTNEPVQHYIDRNIELEKPSDSTPLFTCNRFILNDLPPRRTLRIQGLPDQKENYYPIISTLKSMAIKNINVIIDLNPPDEKCMYLFEIDLRFAGSTCMLIHPLKNHQPNSDFFLVAGDFFPSKMSFDPMDILVTNKPSNRLHILLKGTPRSLKMLICFIKSISFIRTHPYGSYFYIPVSHGYIDITIFMPLVICVLVYYILDWIWTPHHVSVPRIFLGSLLYSFFPISFLFFTRKNEFLCLSTIFMVLNPKIGLAYIGICYLRMVYDTFSIAIQMLKSSRMSPMDERSFINYKAKHKVE